MQAGNNDQHDDDDHANHEYDHEHEYDDQYDDNHKHGNHDHNTDDIDDSRYDDDSWNDVNARNDDNGRDDDDGDHNDGIDGNNDGTSSTGNDHDSRRNAIVWAGPRIAELSSYRRRAHRQSVHRKGAAEHWLGRVALRARWLWAASDRSAGSRARAQALA